MPRSGDSEIWDAAPGICTHDCPYCNWKIPKPWSLGQPQPVIQASPWVARIAPGELLPLIEFGKFAERDRQQRGEGKPEMFDFLGFTHISGKDRNGNFALKRKTVSKRMRAKLEVVKQQLRQRMHEPVALTGKWLRSVVQGCFNYHAAPGNTESLRIFRYRVTRLWRQILRRRGQKHHLNWARMGVDGFRGHLHQE